MKKNIHPENKCINARCLCGKNFTVFSTESEIVTSFCSGCHPFYTGAQQHADVAGRIDKFKKRFGNKSFLDEKK